MQTKASYKYVCLCLCVCVCACVYVRNKDFLSLMDLMCLH